MPQQPQYNFSGIPPAMTTESTGQASTVPDEESTVAKILRLLDETATGAVKGVADTGRSAVSMVPGVEPLSRKVGNILGGYVGEKAYGTKANEVPASAVESELEGKTKAERVGKTGEQLAEFLMPATGARKAAVGALARMTPSSITPKALKLMNYTVNPLVGRAIGEAGQAGAIAAAHGDEHPGRSAALGAAGPLAANAVSKSLPAIADALPFFAGGAAWHAMPSMTGLAGGMGAAAYVRKMLKDYLQDPTRLKSAMQRAYQLTPYAARGAAGVQSEATRQPYK